MKKWLRGLCMAPMVFSLKQRNPHCVTWEMASHKACSESAMPHFANMFFMMSCCSVNATQKPRNSWAAIPHSCSGVGEKTKPYSLFLGSYQWGKKECSIYVQKMPKKATFIASGIRYFNVLSATLTTSNNYTYGSVWPDLFLLYMILI